MVIRIFGQRAEVTIHSLSVLGLNLVGIGRTRSQIGQAVPVRHVMRKKGLITFEPEETVEDVKRTVSKKRIRYYPLMDEQGRYVGMFSQRNLLDLERPSVILVRCV